LRLVQIDLTNQVAIVNRGASSVGAATARVFSAAGARIMIVGRDEALARGVATEIGAEVRIGDVSDSRFCDATIAFALERFGRVDALVNVAEVIVPLARTMTSDADWARVMDVNVMHCTSRFTD
jgi:NAD(P)-dependent dehydrogenase (short-subunit alcohol dehydrogenase family)